MTEGYRTTHTPKALHDAYRNLTVQLPDLMQVFFVDIREYRNFGLPNSEFSCVAGVKFGYDKLVRAIARDGKKLGPYRYELNLLRQVAGPPPIDDSIPGLAAVAPHGLVAAEKLIVHTTDLLRVFVGKGSPDEIQLALRLAIYYGLVQPTLGALQTYCNDYIGLDCSGFTGVYYGPPFRGKSSVEYRKAGQAVDDLNSIVPGCAIVWLNTNHIAIVDSIVQPYQEKGVLVGVECMVAEATGAQLSLDDPNDGLNYSSYTILKKKKGWDVTRRIVRGSELRDTNPTVTIRSL